jgi:hypothetical protein
LIRPLFNACKYVASLQWIEDGGRFVIRTLTFGSVAVPDTKPETVKEDLKTSKGFSAKLLVLLNAIVRFIAYMEIGIWFWFLVFFLLVLAYVLVFGPLRPVHEW